MNIYHNISHIQEHKLEDEQYYIYAIENTAKNIKVGITKNASQRISSLSGSNGGGNKITRCAVSEPTYVKTMEKTIHMHLHRYRIKGTEWFKNISFEDVVKLIDSLFNSDGYKHCNELRKTHGYTRKRL